MRTVGNGWFLLAVSEGNCRILVTKVKFEGGIKNCYFEILVSFLNALTLL